MFNILHTIKLSKQELKLWLYIFMALCLAYLPLLFNFIWGNHDWLPLLKDNHLSSGFIEGRISQYLLNCLLLMGKMLPILNTLLGFTFYGIALVLLTTRFFTFPVTKNTYLFLPTVAILPYITDIIYFQFIVLSQLSWPFVVTLALLAGKKATHTSHFIIFTTLCTLLLFIAISGYPASVNLFVTASCLYLILQYDTNANFKELTKQALPFIISFIISFTVLYGVHAWLLKNNMMMNMYNNQTVKIQDLFLKIFPTIKLSLISLLQPQPFFNLTYKLTSSAILLIFFIVLLKNKKEKNALFLTAVLLLILLLCLKFSAWLTNETPDNYFAKYDPAAFMVRTDFYAIPLTLLFALSYTTATNNLYKNIVTFLSAILLLGSLNADLTFSKTHLLGFKAEALLQQRINNRIQEMPAYNRYSYYTITQAGEIPLRKRYYQPTIGEKYGYYTLETPYTRYWITFEYYNFYEPYNFVREGTTINPQDISPEMINFLTQKIKSWPSPDSLYVDDIHGIIALTPQGKNMLTSQFKQLGTGR